MDIQWGGVWYLVFLFAVFFHAMVQELPWSRGGAAAFSVSSMVQAIISPVCGMLIDRWCARASRW